MYVSPPFLFEHINKTIRATCQSDRGPISSHQGRSNTLEKRPRAPVFVADNTILLRRLLCHSPDMLPVTVPALHIHSEVNFMLSNPRYAGMAAQTILVMGSYLARLMRLVALIAIELHRRLFVKDDLFSLLDRDSIGRKEPHIHGGIFLQPPLDALIVAVTIQTLHPSRFEVLGTVSVAVDAGKTAHAFAVNLLARMALGAEFFRGQEMMKTRLVGLHLSVALCAFDLLHVNVFGVEQGFVDPGRFAFGVALVAVFRVHDDLPFMALGHRVWTLQHKADQQLVLFQDREVMTVMTVELLMLALRPAVVCRLHQMAADTELGIVLSKIVKFEGDKSAAENDDQEQCDNKQFCLQGHRLFQSIQYPLDLFPGPSNQIHFPPKEIQSEWSLRYC